MTPPNDSISSAPTSAADAHDLYAKELDVDCVPLAPGQKAPTDDGWPGLAFERGDYGVDGNIGGRTGSKSDGYVDMDLDAPETIAAARTLAPPTDMVHGRESRPESHRGFRCRELATAKTQRWKDVDDSVLIELRADGAQTMLPPSVHPTGERVTWTRFGKPAEVDAAALIRAARLIATAALVARHSTGKGSRHELALALGGFLARIGLTAEECGRVARAAAIASGDDEPHDRERAAYESATKIRDNADAEITGGGVLLKLLSDGDKVLARIGEWFGAKDFVRDKNNKIIANSQENILLGAERLGVALAHDTFAERMIATRAGVARTFSDDVIDGLWLEVDRRFRFRPSLDFFLRVLQDAARSHPFHPVRDYLDALAWDGTPRVDRWLSTYGRANDSPYTRAVGALTLVAAVRRARAPGCKFDEMMVLESAQGTLKSSALKALCPDDTWHSDDLPLGADSKVTIEATLGKWIVEAAELSGMRRTQVEQLKATLSRQVDGPCRMAYARLPIERPRAFVIVGTTNAETYLKDATGNRRFWPVRVERFDVEALRRDRDQLWAEAAQREAQDESIRLDHSLWADAGRQQEARRHEDPWEATLDAAFTKRFHGKTRHRLTTDDAWQTLGIKVADRDERGQERIAAVMQRLGFRRMAIRPDGNKAMVVKGWGRDQMHIDEVTA